MALVHNNNLGVYAGVSTQAVDLRLPSHCEQMINCYPSVQYGVRRRNPTESLSTAMLVEDRQFRHSYDRGLSGDSSEQYTITIDETNKLQVYDVQANEYRPVTYSGSAEKYLESSNPQLGFSAITIKDSTFIANRDIIPMRYGDTDLVTNYVKITFNGSGYSSLYSTVKNSGGGSSISSMLAPCRLKTFKGDYVEITYAEDNSAVTTPKTIYAESAAGATISITIDGSTFVYKVGVKSDGYNTYPETIQEMRSNIYSMLVNQLNGSLYVPRMDTANSIVVNRLDGAAVSASVTVDIPATVDVSPPAISSLIYIADSGSGLISGLVILPRTAYLPVTWTYLTAYAVGSGVVSGITTGTATNGTFVESDYDNQGFVWISRVSVDTAFPYTFYLSLSEENGTVIASTSSSATTTTGVASDFASWANGLADFTGTVKGSVAKITRDSGLPFVITVSDTYGSQASSAWKGVISSMDDLPKSFPFKDTIVKVDGVQRNDDAAYYVKYDGNSWVEWRDPNMLYKIDPTTMPHRLSRNSDFTFTLAPVVWDDILVGDENTNPLPEFLGSNIMDMFLVNGRLGIVTKNGISLSQVGNFANFFRTTILKLLDDSAITTYIDSTRSVGLQYASELQGSIVLFGDKLQFLLDASRPISPASIVIEPVSGYEINKNVRPLSVGDSVFFVIKRNGYSALMEMSKDTISSNIKAIDVSSHVPNYIDSNIVQLISSPTDNTIFLKGLSNPRELYVYRYLSDRGQYAQQAWSKWTFSMNVNSIFCFDNYLYLLGNRYDSVVDISSYPLVSVWDDTKVWLDETNWYDTSIPTYPAFERLVVDSYDVSASFKDNNTTDYESFIELSEWMLHDAKDSSEIRGTLLMKTISISSADNSDFSLLLFDKERNSSRLIPSVYTVDRKPYIGGNSKNMVIKIQSNDGAGFQINSISLEGQYNVRSKRV